MVSLSLVTPETVLGEASLHAPSPPHLYLGSRYEIKNSKRSPIKVVTVVDAISLVIRPLTTVPINNNFLMELVNEMKN